MNYKFIINKIEEIVQGHEVIKGFVVGRNWEALESSRNALEFPIIQVQSISAVLNRINENAKWFPTLDVSIQFRCLDLIDKNENNRLTVESDTLTWLQQIVDFSTHYKWFQDNMMELSNSFILFNPEEYRTTTPTAGWSCILTFKISNWNGVCGLPFDDSSDVFKAIPMPKLPDSSDTINVDIGTTK